MCLNEEITKTKKLCNVTSMTGNWVYLAIFIHERNSNFMLKIDHNHIELKGQNSSIMFYFKPTLEATSVCRSGYPVL